MNNFNYENTEIVAQKGGKIVRKVSIKKGRGYKTVTKYRRGKKVHTVKKPIHKAHISWIKKGKFIPGLFNDCKTKKCRGGGSEYDIEMGRDSPTTYISKVPADPERFKQQNLKIVQNSFNPVTASTVAKVFAGPTPEQKIAIENSTMLDEDPRFTEPFQREPLEIFKRGGRRTRRKRKHFKRRYSRRGGDKSIPVQHELDEASDYEPMDEDNEDNEDNEDDENRMDEDDVMDEGVAEEFRQRLQNLIDEAEAHIEKLDNRLYEIEQMTGEERKQHKEEEERLQQEINKYINIYEDFKETVQKAMGQTGEDA